MSTPIYPSSLPGVSRITLRSEPILVDDGDGVKSFRRRSATRIANAQITFVFVDTDFQAFVEFCRTTLLGSHKWFWLKLPSAGGVTWHVVRIAPGTKPQARMLGHGAWTVDAEIAIRKRAFEEQPEPPIDPEPPTEDEDMALVVHYRAIFPTVPFDGTEYIFPIKDQYTADNAQASHNDGQISLLLEGIYEITIVAQIQSNAFTNDAHVSFGTRPYGLNSGSVIMPTESGTNGSSRHFKGTDDSPFFSDDVRTITDSFIVKVDTGQAPQTFTPTIFANGYFISDTYAPSLSVTVRYCGPNV